MLSQNPRVQEAWELDLPVVIDGKRALLERLKERREKTKGLVQLPELRSVDLNDLDAVNDVLAQFVRHKKGGESWHTIYVIEGVMMFLNDGLPKELFQLFREVARAHGENASICFADHLTSSENNDSLTDEEERETVKSLFNSAGWNHLIHWAVKPGKARQMGCVRIHE
jgi:O-methyltransferase involved in polyketide biosynthesis